MYLFHRRKKKEIRQAELRSLPTATHLRGPVARLRGFPSGAGVCCFVHGYNLVFLSRSLSRSAWRVLPLLSPAWAASPFSLSCHCCDEPVTLSCGDRGGVFLGTACAEARNMTAGSAHRLRRLPVAPSPCCEAPPEAGVSDGIWLIVSRV